MKLEPIQQLLTSLSKNEISAITKLVTIEILDTLGDNKYIIQQGTNTLTATSDKPLNINKHYWATLTTDDKIVTLSNLIKYPPILKEMQHLPIIFKADELGNILKQKDPLTTIKDLLLQNISHTTSKHQFTQISNLILPLIHNIITIPLTYQGNFGIFQLKKRYNKKNKKIQLDFYAAFNNLGPISGLISLLHDDILININVAFLSTKLFLEKHLKEIQYSVKINIKKNINTLRNLTSEGLLDLNA